MPGWRFGVVARLDGSGGARECSWWCDGIRTAEGAQVSGIGDDEAVVGSINKAIGARLSVEGRAEKGTLGGAILVSLDDSRRGVVTRFLGSLTHAQQTAEVLAEVKRDGVPVPDHYSVVPVGDAVFVVQERLPGRPPAVVTPAVVTAITALNERFGHLLPERPDVPHVALCLTAWRTICSSSTTVDMKSSPLTATEAVGSWTQSASSDGFDRSRRRRTI